MPVSRPVVRRVHAYSRQERPRSPLRSLFLTDRETALRYYSLRLMLDRHFERAGLEPKRPHAFRRGFAVQFVKNGGDVFSLQRILGHATLAMSNRYAALSFEDVKEVHLRAAPAGRRP